ncbi:MAG: DUF3878 family protein, partial [Oscillospiraceae bacterium]|nr:DUF3878 family protein [Oscillospiraceae bacterium]
SESILPLYPETKEGALAFAEIADTVGDKWLEKKIRLYNRFPNPLLAIHIANRLCRKKSIPAYDHIFTRVCNASARYASRDFGADKNVKISAEREKVTAALHAEGFTGTYPLFRKAGMEVLAAEEHPFTILETDEYRFRIRFMVSEYPKNEQPSGVCSGFFSGRGHKGRIYAPEKHSQTKTSL